MFVEVEAGEGLGPKTQNWAVVAQSQAHCVKWQWGMVGKCSVVVVVVVVWLSN